VLRGQALLESEAVSRSFAAWILSEKRRRRPSSLYVVGVNGTLGQGKTVFSQAVVKHLNTLLSPQEGQAFTRSLDDYYLQKAERCSPEFLSLGYNPGAIPNRGPAGTHDTARLWKDLEALEMSRPDSVTNLPVFDKPSDDRSPEPYRIQGRVGVFILEGWFVGAKTDVDPAQAPAGLKRSVATALRKYKPIFDRLDALWVFEPPKTLEEIVYQRMEQQETLNKETGTSGMTPEQIRRFVRYFYQDCWEPGLTSPIPPPGHISFLTVMDRAHRIIRISPELKSAPS